MPSRRILRIEDSSTRRRRLRTLLEREGFEVRTAEDGPRGLAAAREEPRPESILTDCETPELDGPGFCTAARADVDLRSIPVLMLTAGRPADDINLIVIQHPAPRWAGRGAACRTIRA